MTSLAVCDECKAEMKLDDLLTEEGWSMIVEAFLGRGRARPKRSRTELVFTLLGDVPGQLKPN